MNRPTVNLFRLLELLGPSAIILYKQVLAKGRILILTRPPVETACILTYLAARACIADRQNCELKACPVHAAEPPITFGLVTLNDLTALHSAETGWLACQ
jgi:hypothetical protein